MQKKSSPGKKKRPSFLSFKAAGLGLVGIIAGLAVAFFITNRRAEMEITAYAQKIFDVPVSIRHVRISPLSQGIKISGLKIANPDGFNAAYAVTIDEINIAARSLAERPLPVAHMELHGVIAYPERDTYGDTNLAALYDRVFDQESADNGFRLTVTPADITITDVRLVPVGAGYAALGQPITVPDYAPVSGNQATLNVTPEDLTKVIFRIMGRDVFQALLAAEIKAGIDEAARIGRNVLHAMDNLARDIEHSFRAFAADTAQQKHRP